MNSQKSAVTPMMAQYLDIKVGYPDALLFYRMGDFYELFFDDAVAAAEALDIALTKRGKHLGEDIAMCGVPFHAAEGYLLTLIRKGFRVAVCEQMESPAEAKKRGSKSVVRREVVRLVTPGTLSEETLLDASTNNFLAAFGRVRDTSALAWVDMSTGEFFVQPCTVVRLGPELARIGVRELIVAERDFDALAETIDDIGGQLTTLGNSAFDSQGAETRLKAFYKVGDLDAFGGLGRAEVSALGAVLDYLELTQKGQLPFLRRPQRIEVNTIMTLDAATRRSLEITTTMSGTRVGSLLECVDRTVTASGARTLRKRLSTPKRDLERIEASHANVAWAVEAAERDMLRGALRLVPDLERAVSRLSLGRGGPRDLTGVRTALQQAATLHSSLIAADLPVDLAKASASLVGFDSLTALLAAALVAEPPLLARDGGFIAHGFNAQLDDLRTLRDEGRGVIAGLQSDYAKLADVVSLKIKHNNVLGYFVETTQTHAKKMASEPLNETFIHRQTTANVVRFTTVELSELETRILNASSEADAIEMRLYATLVEAILDEAGALLALASGLAEFDVSLAFADLARDRNWCRPDMTSGHDFDIVGGRHPVVEAAMISQSTSGFVANDCNLDEGKIWLLTGPNMAGKSTFLRQNALIALLAQAGSFVPATSARLGVVSQLFSRVGASDDLARGRSTFMVEMVETAAILNQADDRALVILDEIGRGTSTYDGLSIAWATLEHLHEVNGCRALFATHYHEMTQLQSRLNRVENATVRVREWEGEIVFLHEVHLGAADRSYGVQVAKLAGLPTSVTDRAREVLDQLESADRKGTGAEMVIDDLPLFSAAPTQAPPAPSASDVEARLDDVSPDALTPRDALDLIYELKALATKD